MEYIRSLIINKPEELQYHHKITAVSLTFVFWFIIFYLWQPLIALVAWAFGFKLFYEHMVILGGFSGFLKLIVIYTLVVIALGIVFILWAKINQWRFRGKCKRKAIPNISDQDIQEYFKVTPEQFASWKQKKNLTIDIDDDFVITEGKGYLAQ